MNKVYRLVWSRAHACWMVASEIARSGGSPRSALITSSLMLTLLSLPVLGSAAFAAPVPTVTPSSGNTRSYLAPNGVTVVDIATANSAGVSVNLYSQYNIGTSGLVLNNGVSSQLTRQSLLAGQVYANVNLLTPATLILNEVTSPSRSVLAGFTEVLGSKADVVVANPYGITCTGCGFINTDRVTLSTGTPVLSADGSLSGLQVNQGDILVTGTGLNSSAQQLLDLVSRSVTIDGQVNAPDLGLTAGPNQWNYATRAVTGSTVPAGTAPAYAIDSTVLGGMYANKIFLVSTEAGVGVRMLGNVAAAAGDVTLNSAGDVFIGSQLSAGNNLSVNSSSADASAIQLNDASLTAAQNLIISSQGGLTFSGSALVANQNLSVIGSSLTDTSDSNMQSNNNMRFAGNNLSVNIGGTGIIDGTQWGAGAGTWQGTFGKLNIAAQGATLYGGTTLNLTSTAGDLSLGTAQIKAAGDLTLLSSGAIETGSSFTQGLETTAGNLSLSAENGLNNAGTMSSDTGTVNLAVSGTLVNSGVIHSAGTLTITDAAGGATENMNITGSGQLLTDSVLNLQAAVMTTSPNAWVQAATGSTLQLVSLNNAGSCLLSATAVSGTPVPVDVMTLSGTFANSGTVQSANALTLTAASADNAGNLLAANNITANIAGALTTGTGSMLQSGQTLTVNSDSISNAGTFKAATVVLTATGSGGLTNSGTIEADSGVANLAINGVIADSGVIYSAGALTVADAAGAATENINLTGSGQLLTDSTLNLQAAAVSTSPNAWVQAATGSTLQLTSLNNSGSWLLSAATGSAPADSLILSGGLMNSGTLQSAHDLFLGATSMDNSGQVLVAGNLTGAVAGSLTNEAAGSIQAGGDLSVNIGTGNLTDSGNLLAGGTLTLAALNGADAAVTVGGNGVVQGNVVNISTPQLTINDNGAVISQSDMNLALGTLTMGDSNALIVAASGGVGTGTITLANSLVNNGAVLSGDSLLLTAPDITNTVTGVLAAQNNLVLTSTTGDLSNSGALYSGGTLTASADNGTISNVGSATTGAVGTINADGAIILNAQTIVNNSKINSNGDITLSAGTIINESPGGDTRTLGPQNGNTTNQTGDTGMGYHCACVFNQCETWYYAETWNQQQSYTGGLTPFVADIIAGGTLTLQNFDTAANLGGVLSGNTVTISGNSGATFTNDPLSLLQYNYQDTWDTYEELIAAGPLVQTYATDQNDSGTVLQSVTTLYNTGAGIYANTLNAGGFGLSGAGAARRPLVTVSGINSQILSEVAAVPAIYAKNYTGVNSVPAMAGLAFSGPQITLPATPAGYVVPQLSPVATYLTASNAVPDIAAQTQEQSNTLTQLNLNPTSTQTVLENSSYAAELTQQQLLTQTDTDLTSDYQNQLGANLVNAGTVVVNDSTALTNNADLNFVSAPGLVSVSQGVNYVANLNRQQYLAQTDNNLLSGYQNQLGASLANAGAEADGHNPGVATMGEDSSATDLSVQTVTSQADIGDADMITQLTVLENTGESDVGAQMPALNGSDKSIPPDISLCVYQNEVSHTQYTCFEKVWGTHLKRIKIPASGRGEHRHFIAFVAVSSSGGQVRAVRPDGRPLPVWLKFDSSSGKLYGNPPATFFGEIDVDVDLKQADGTKRQVLFTFTAS